MPKAVNEDFGVGVGVGSGIGHGSLNQHVLCSIPSGSRWFQEGYLTSNDAVPH